MVGYFQRHGARPLAQGENPAEWLIDKTSMSTTAESSTIDWTSIWSKSGKRQIDLKEYDILRKELTQSDTSVETESSEFATSLWHQLRVVTIRAFAHDWRLVPPVSACCSPSCTTRGTSRSHQHTSSFSSTAAGKFSVILGYIVKPVSRSTFDR